HAVNPSKVLKRSPHPMPTDIERYKVCPRRQTVIPPFSEQACLERQTAGEQEGQEAPAEACAVEIEEVFIAPVTLEVCR
nr:hypothetical protein [Tanacetum cinerariifolium]